MVVKGNEKNIALGVSRMKPMTSANDGGNVKAEACATTVAFALL